MNSPLIFKMLISNFDILKIPKFWTGIWPNAFFLVFYCDVSSRTMEFHEKMHSSQTPRFYVAKYFKGLRWNFNTNMNSENLPMGDHEINRQESWRKSEIEIIKFYPPTHSAQDHDSNERFVWMIRFGSCQLWRPLNP